MKRSQLNVGDELFYATPGDWRDNREPHNAHVRVAAVEPHAKARWGNREPYKTSTGTGTGVLVDVLNADGTDARYQDVVQLGHLRGPYAETLAAVKDAAKAARKRMEADWERADAEKAKTEHTVKRARTAGAASTMRHGESVVTMRAAHLDALLDRLSQAETMLDNLHSVNNPELA